jgi:1,4-dihydroxy-6-naphthoate synthase
VVAPIKNIRFGHSPDPDDAFMFYAFAHETIPMRGFKVTHVIEDIESLNQRALKNAELEVTAVSCHAYAYLADKYAVMRSGASIGEKYGPILVSKNQEPGTKNQVRGKRIAIPGKLTTAYLALQIYEKNFEPVFIPFDQIMDAVKSGQVDFGLVIHEGQLTHFAEGLHKVLDLGEWWHQETGLPLPLGVDVIRKDLGAETMREFALLFKESIQHSLQNRKPALEYAIQYGRGLSEDLNDRFVGMYVNDRTVEIGADGEAGFRRLLDEGFKKGILPKPVAIEFVPAAG